MAMEQGSEKVACGMALAVPGLARGAALHGEQT
jgi:hypothetical protein